MRRIILILALALLVPGLCFGEWKQTRHGFCVDSETGRVAKCTPDESGKLTIGQEVITRNGECPT
jgi:hypothetical protein